MATSCRTATPPPPSSINTPTTPKHGWEDSYQPYSPRKSARVSSQRSRAAQTPPPPNLRNSSKKVASTSTPGSTLSPPPTSSIMASSKRVTRGGSVSGALNYGTTASGSSALDLPAPVRDNGMLPTPAKTPKKKSSEIVPGIASIARNLFPIRGETAEAVMPTPKKKGRKYAGFSLDQAEDEDAPIPIYTDTTDRIPEADTSAANPFYGNHSAPQPEPTKRSIKRRKITIPGEGEQTVEEAERREDGLIYVFRGKKIFRKFSDEVETGTPDHNDSDAEADTELEEDLPSSLRRPLTRSSIKPRLLFPSAHQAKAAEMRSQATEDEEEAVTDIEEPNNLSTPTAQTDDVVATPKAPKFAPASPPTTARVTRSKKLDMTSSPAGPSRDGSVSPFLGWAIDKGKGRATSGSKKRAGEPLKRAGGAKKTRG